jgi:hypothetical protein
MKYLIIKLSLLKKTRELGITGALKFENCKCENCHFTVTVTKENK